MISVQNKRATGLFRQRYLVPILSLTCTLALLGCGGGSAKQTLPVYYSADAQVPVTGPDAVGAQPFDTAVSALLRKWNIPGAAMAYQPEEFRRRVLQFFADPATAP